MITNILKIVALILSILSLIAIMNWVGGIDEYLRCLNDNKINSADCFTGFIMKSPPIQEVQEIAEACDNSDAECLLKIGEKAATEKVQMYAEDN